MNKKKIITCLNSKQLHNLDVLSIVKVVFFITLCSPILNMKLKQRMIKTRRMKTTKLCCIIYHTLQYNQHMQNISHIFICTQPFSQTYHRQWSSGTQIIPDLFRLQPIKCFETDTIILKWHNQPPFLLPNIVFHFIIYKHGLVSLSQMH